MQLYRSHSSSLICLEAGPRRTPLRRRPPTRLASRCCSAPSRALSVDDENPRLTACTAWDCLPALRTHIASIVSIIFFGVVQSGIHESVPTAILAAFSHNPSFSVHGVVPATRLSLDTRSHNDRPSIAIQASTSSIACVRSGSRDSKPAAAPYRLRCARYSVPRSDELRTIRSLSGHPARAHHVRISSSEALKNQEGVSSHARPPLVTPPSRQESRASSDAPDAFSAPSMPASLERSIRRALYRSCHAHGLDTTPVRTQIRPRYQLHAQHATLAFLAALVASSPSRTLTTFTTSCARDGRSPPPAPLLSPPPTPSASPASTTIPDPHARRALACTTSRVHSTCSSRSPLPAPRLSSPTRRHRVQLLTILRSKPAPVRHREYDAQHRRSAQQLQRAFPVARAAFIPSPCAATILCAHAALRSKPRPAAHRERDVHHPRRVTLQPSPSPRNRPAFHVHPQRHSAPLVADSATPPPMRSTPRGGFPSPAPAAFAAMAWLRASSGRMTRRRCAPRAKDF
ncbi:hypothetical protein B0H14DRAFT_3879749 [Mycena olivaceomarginata]|nr:hypothetical protein B0H14DRAFT_3879749 [Mycena olivaceomarginata]